MPIAVYIVAVFILCIVAFLPLSLLLLGVCHQHPLMMLMRGSKIRATIPSYLVLPDGIEPSPRAYETLALTVRLKKRIYLGHGAEVVLVTTCFLGATGLPIVGVLYVFCFAIRYASLVRQLCALGH